MAQDDEERKRPEAQDGATEGAAGPRPGPLVLLLAGMMLSGLGAALGGVAGLAVALGGGGVLGLGAWGLLRGWHGGR